MNCRLLEVESSVNYYK